MKVTDNQVLAVWGSPSCGKTVIATKIAKHISLKKKNVILLLCDAYAPPLPLLISPSDIEQEKSLGSILAATRISDNLIMQNSILLKKHSYISILGMLKGENVYTYPKYTDRQASELIEHLRNLAPYIIIDCGSHISDDVLSTVALMHADSVLRLVNCDLKSISYLSSQLPLLIDKKFKVDKQIKVASNVKSIHASENIEQVLGGVSFTIPYSEGIENQYLTGELLKDVYVNKDSKGFRKAIDAICEEVFDL